MHETTGGDEYDEAQYEGDGDIGLDDNFDESQDIPFTQDQSSNEGINMPTSTPTPTQARTRAPSTSEVGINIPTPTSTPTLTQARTRAPSASEAGTTGIGGGVKHKHTHIQNNNDKQKRVKTNVYAAGLGELASTIKEFVSSAERQVEK